MSSQIRDTELTLAITAPTGGAPLGFTERTPVAEVQPAIDRARTAQPAWARRTLAERADLLEAAADLLEPQLGELGKLLASESGKPIQQARNETRWATDLLRSNAQVGRRMVGEVLPTEGQHGTELDIAFTRRVPLGVIAVVLPFNFPVELFVEKCAAALVAGNTVVVKAPLEDPLTVGRFHAALIDAGVPNDALVLLHGDRDVGAALAAGDGIDAISLTGSTGAGVAVAQASADRLRRLHLELGGNNACLVLDDADLDLVVSELSYGRLLMNGQACAASKRILVHSSLHDALAERLSAFVGAAVVGPATDEATTIGPLISMTAADRVAGQIQRAVAEGAELAAGTGVADGAYVAPVVLANVPHSAAVATDDEIFGPAFSLIPVGGPAEAVELANRSSFGLMGSVFSRDVQRAMAVAERLEVGGVVLNGTDNYRPPIIPFGGVKMSGSGREGIGYTIDELSTVKSIILRRFRSAEDELR